MKIAGIIAEYNPFHNGHKYHIEKTRELTGATHIVAVMSSNYVQRGETSLMSKWARAEAAVKNGVDLVVELPTLWSSSYAQRFALGGVDLLNSLGCVDIISFGSENGNIDELIACRDALQSEAVDAKIKENLESGLGYASARAEAVGAVYGDRFFDILGGANNTLGIEYLNSLQKTESKIKPFTVARTGAAHDSAEKSEEFASASEIRRMILAGDSEWERYVPQSVIEIYRRECENGLAPCTMDKLNLSVLCCMRRLSAEDISAVPDISEGIEYRIRDAALRAQSLSDLYTAAKTRRYSHSRIRRIILHSFLGITEKNYKEKPPYAHILAMNDGGKEILRKAKETANVPVITKASDFDELSGYGKEVFEIENMCTDIYSLTPPEIQPCGREKTSGIIVV